mmetsp:Transcript_3872/g.10618  ORF Transcript_3872/g.10618 Transcript_3872/m.10618 type:complete len:204 (+) Transcript_3872:925-1536(+)
MVPAFALGARRRRPRMRTRARRGTHPSAAALDAGRGRRQLLGPRGRRRRNVDAAPRLQRLRAGQYPRTPPRLPSSTPAWRPSSAISGTRSGQGGPRPPRTTKQTPNLSPPASFPAAPPFAAEGITSIRTENSSSAFGRALRAAARARARAKLGGRPRPVRWRGASFPSSTRCGTSSRRTRSGAAPGGTGAPGKSSPMPSSRTS